MLGGGGYVAGPIGLAAVLRGHAARAHRGRLAPRPDQPHARRRARRVCLAFPIEGRDGDRYLLTGRPVPPTITDREAARAEFGLEPGELTVLVFGGSLGARSINQRPSRRSPTRRYRSCTSPGAATSPSSTTPGPHYVLRDYVVPFGTALAAADLAVARAGGSVFELAQYGLPSVLIPYPHASGNHQEANARWMEQAGAATILPDAELTPERLRAEVDALVADEPRRRAMALAAAKLARPDAARAIAREVLARRVEHTSARSRTRRRSSVIQLMPRNGERGFTHDRDPRGVD